MQYLVAAVPGGATVVGVGSRLAAGIGDAATIMLSATANSLCAISFLLEWRRQHIRSTPKIRGRFDQRWRYRPIYLRS
jgi:hypothetical protein